MALGMNPLGEGDLPEDYIENADGSVEIPELETTELNTEDFYQNLAEALPEDELRAVADDLIELIERDREARKKRDEQFAQIAFRRPWRWIVLPVEKREIATGEECLAWPGTESRFCRLRSLCAPVRKTGPLIFVRSCRKKG